MAFNTIFCSLYSHCFSSKNSKPSLSMKSTCSLWDKAILKASWFPWTAGHHLLYKTILDNINQLLQWTFNSSMILALIFGKGGWLRIFCWFIGSFYFKEVHSHSDGLFCFVLTFQLGLVCDLIKTDWGSKKHGKEAQIQKW